MLQTLIFQRCISNYFRSSYNYLCTCDLYTPVHNVLEAWIYIMWGSWKVLGPGIPEFFGPCEMATSRQASAIWGPKIPVEWRGGIILVQMIFTCLRCARGRCVGVSTLFIQHSTFEYLSSLSSLYPTLLAGQGPWVTTTTRESVSAKTTFRCGVISMQPHVYSTVDEESLSLHCQTKN